MMLTLPNSEQLKDYTFFLRGQSIFKAGSATPPVYGVIEDEIDIIQNGQVVDTTQV